MHIDVVTPQGIAQGSYTPSVPVANNRGKEPEMGGTKMQVLIVEDDAALGSFLQRGMKLEGHDVEWVGDGEAALLHVEEHRPDLMVLDLSLPRKDGTEVLAEMQGRFDEMAVLVLTGRSEVEERVKCLNLGADDYL